MIATVSLSEGTTWTKAPWRFEAGTPNTGALLVLVRRWSMYQLWGLTTLLSTNRI